MRNKLGKKLLSLFLAFVILLTSLSVGLTAFADPSNWSGTFTVNGQDVTSSIDAIAHALYGTSIGRYNTTNYQDLNGKAITKTVENLNLDGNYLVDDEFGNMSTLVRHIWAIAYTAADIMGKDTGGCGGNDYWFDRSINVNVVPNLKKYVGSDWNEEWDHTKSPYLFSYCIGVMGKNGWATGSNTEQGSRNVIIELHPKYYLWNAYGDNLNNLTNVLVTHKAYWWKNRKTSYGGHVPSQANLDRDYYGTLVNGDQIKSFGNLFTAIWSDFRSGTANDLGTGKGFDAIDTATQIAILNDAMDLFDHIRNDVYYEDKDKGVLGYAFPYERESSANQQTVRIYTSAENTKKIFKHFFMPLGANDDDNTDAYTAFLKYYDNFLDYMVSKFVKAVNQIEADLYDGVYTGGNIKDSLKLDDLRRIKAQIDDAYSMWNGFNPTLQARQNAKDAKAKLDRMFYFSSDNGSKSTSFVTHWNNTISQAYIDVVEKLEYASDTYNREYSPDDLGKYQIKNKIEANAIKALLDEADSLWGDLYWELSYNDNAKYKKDPNYAGRPNQNDLTRLSNNLRFESLGSDLVYQDEDHPDEDPVYTGIRALTWARQTHKGDGLNYGAQTTYERWLLRLFLQIANDNLGEYLQGDRVVIPGNLTVIDIVPIRAKISRVTNAYNDLPARFQSLPEVQKWMNIIWGNGGNNLQKALDDLLKNDTWQKYTDLKYPYYYNWDEKLPGITIDNHYSNGNQVANLLSSLNTLLNSTQVKQLLKDEDGKPRDLATFAYDTIESLLTGESANNLLKTVLMLLGPLIQDAMKGVAVEQGTIGVSTNGLDAQRNNVNGSIIGINVVIKVDILYPDPNMLYKRMAAMTSNKEILDACTTIGAAGINWNLVEWDKVDFKIDTIDEFCEAMGGVLNMIPKLVRCLLFDERPHVDLSSDSSLFERVANSLVDMYITDYHNKGYEKDIIPFLELIGCTGINDYNTALGLANQNKWVDLLKNLIHSLVGRLTGRYNYQGEVLLSGNNVIQRIFGVLPNLAYVLLYDKITGPKLNETYEYNDKGEIIKINYHYPHWSEFNDKTGYTALDGYSGINDLLAPLTELAGLALPGFGISNIDSTFLMDTINGLLSGTDFVIPDINWGKIAGLGQWTTASSVRASKTRNTITPDSEKIIVYFIYWLSSFITENDDALFELLMGLIPAEQEGLRELVSQLLDHLIATASDEQAFGAVIFELLRAVDTHDYDWTSTWDWEQFLVNYTGLPYTEDEVVNAVDKLTAIVGNVVNNFLFKDENGDKLTLKEFLNSNVFTGNLINTLFKTIYSLDSETIRTIFSFIEVKDANGMIRNIDMSPKTMATVLRNAGFTKIATVIGSADYYVSKDDDGNETFNVFNFINDEMWGIEGSENPTETFRKALVAILDPFKYNIGTILAGDKTGQGGQKGSTAIAGGALTINGYNGYRNGLKAVLAVFGSGLLDGTRLVPESEFENDPNGSLNLITKMLFELIDAYCADPLGAIIEVIPQVASFIHNGGLQNSLAQVIQPLWNILSAVLDLFQINNDIVPDSSDRGGNNHTYYPFDDPSASRNNLINIIVDAVFQEENSEYRDIITWDNIQYHIFDFANKFLKGIIKFYETDEEGNTLYDEDGNPRIKESFDIVIPEIDWKDLGGSGTRSTDEMKIDPDKDSVVVKVLRWVWRVVQTNGTALEAIIKNIGDDDTVAGIYEAFTAYVDILGTGNDNDKKISEDDFVNLVVKIINGLDSSKYDSTETWFGNGSDIQGILNHVYEITKVIYPYNVDEDEDYTYEDVDKLVEFISSIAVGALKNFLELDLSDVSKSLYTSMLPLLVVKNLYPVLDSAASVLEILDVKFTFEDFIAALKSSEYAAIADAIAKQTYEFEIKNEDGEVERTETRPVDNFAAIDWDALAEADENLFNVNDSTTLSKALAFVLNPFIPVLDFLFNAGEFDIMGIVPLIGSNGYRNAIYPLFTALGIDASYGAKSAEAYKSEATADKKNVLINIINPIFNWLDKALAFGESGSGPVGAVFGVLPELAALVDNGGIQQFIHDLTYPISNLVDNILLILTKNEKATLFNIVFDFAMAMLAGNDAEEEPEDEGILGTVKKALDTIFGKKEDENAIRWDNVHEHLFELVGMFLDIAEYNEKDKSLKITITINKEEGTTLTIVVPDYKDLLKRLAGVDKTIAKKKTSDSLLLVWQYIWDGILNGRDLDALDKVLDKTTIESVKSLLENLLGDTYSQEVAGYKVSRYLNNLLTSEGNEIVAALIQMMDAMDSSDYIETDFFYGEEGILNENYIFDGLEALTDVQYPALKDTDVPTTDAGHYYNVDDVKELVDALSSIIKTAIMVISGTQNADNISINLLYNDDMMGKLASLIAPLADNGVVKTVLPLLGVEFTKEKLVEKLNYYGYTALAAEIEKYETLSEVPWVDQYKTDDEGNVVTDAKGDPIVETPGIQNLWYVTDQATFLANVYNNAAAEGAKLPEANVADNEILGHYRFAKALSVLLSPFSGLLDALLNAGTTQIAGTVDFTGAPSYGNAIKPLLDALGCDTVDLDAYKAKTKGTDGDGNTDYVLFYLLDPLLAKVDTLIKDPANTLLSMLPKLAAFFDKGGLEQSIMNLLYPVTQLINPLFRLLLDDDMDGVEDADSITVYDLALAIVGIDCTFDKIHENIFDIVAKLLAADDKSEENKFYAELKGDDLVLYIPHGDNGDKFKITIPQYHLDRIAGCGLAESEEKRITDTFVVVFRYVEKILKTNSEDIISIVDELAGGNEGLSDLIKGYLRNVLSPKTEGAEFAYDNAKKDTVNDSLLITLIRVVQNLHTGDFETDDKWKEIGKLPEGVDATFTTGTKADGSNEIYGDTTLALMQFTSAITTLSNIVSSALKEFANLDLANLTEDKFYSNDIVAKIAGIIFPLADNNTVNTILGLLGVDLSKDKVAARFNAFGYTEIADLITEAESLTAIDWEAEDVKALWYVTDEAGFENVWNASDPQYTSSRDTLDDVTAQYRFTRALVAVLDPFADLIGVLLLPYDLGDDKHNAISIADGTIEIDGAFGYKNAIKPLLEALRAEPVDSDTYVEMAKTDSVYILFNILDPLLTKVDAILSDPVNELLSTIPRLANYLKDGGLQLSIENLLYPLTAPLHPIVDLIDDGDIQGGNEAKPSEIFDIVLDYFTADTAYKDLFTWETAHEKIFEIAERVINNFLNDPEDENSLKAVLNSDGSLTLKNVFGLGDEGDKTYIDIKIPAINGPNGLLTKLAACGNPLDLSEYGKEDDDSYLPEGYVRKTVDAAAANSFIVLIEWIWDVVKGNEQTIRTVITKLAGEETYTKLKDYVDHLFGNEGEDIVSAVVAVLNSVDASGYDSTSIWNNILKTDDLQATEVKYPENGYTVQDINDTVKTISGVLVGVLEEFAEIDLSTLTTDYIYQDSIITAVAKIVLNLSDIETVTDIFKFVGEDISKDHIADLLEAAGLTSAAAAIKAAEKAADINWDSVTWNVTDRASFVDALVAVISPLNPVLSYMLLAGTININGVVALTGANGYDNAIKYLLKDAFGIENLPNGSDYQTKEDGKVTATNMNGLLKAVLNAVLGKVEGILASDNLIGTVVDMIPQLALFINAGGVQQFVEDLLYPILNFVNPIVKLISDKCLFDTAFDILDIFDIFKLNADDVKPEDKVTWHNIHNYILELVNDNLLKDVKITIGEGDDAYELHLKLNTNITWAGLAGCAIAKEGAADKTVDEIRSDTILYILYYVWETVQVNREGDHGIDGLIDSLLPEDLNEKLGGYIDNVLDREDMEIVQAIVDVFKAFDTSSHTADWSFLTDGYTSAVINYNTTELPVTKDEVEALIKDLDDVALKAINEYVLKGDYTNLAEFLGTKLYTADLVVKIQDAINGLADNETVTKVLELLGVTLTKNDKDYSSVNDKDTFITALAEILAPFDPIVNAFLSGTDLTIANTITIKAANGFNNAIKPLLEYALGATAGEASIEGLLRSVLDRVDKITEKPAEELLKLIPMLVNFITKGGIQYFVEELLYPVLAIVTPIVNLAQEKGKEKSVFDFALDLIPLFVKGENDEALDLAKMLGIDASELTWKGITNADTLKKIAKHFVSDLKIKIKDVEYSFTIDTLDLAKLASCGTKNTADDKIVDGDQADTFVTLFQIIWNIVKENEETVKKIVNSLITDLDDNIKSTVSGYVDNLFKHGYGDVVEALVDVFKAFKGVTTNADWSFLTKDFTQTTVDYTDLGVTDTEIDGLIEALNDVAVNAVTEFLTNGETLEAFLSGKLYTGDLVGKIQDAINGLADNETIKTVLGLLGVTITKNEKDYSSVNDKDSFINALAEILAPFDKLVAAFLNSGEVDIAKVLTIKGADGFNNAVKPLLEYALGATAGTDPTIKGILTAVLGRVDTLLDKPVNEVLGLIAPLANFIIKGGVQYFIEQLLAPVIGIATPILKLVQDPEATEEVNFFDFVLNLLPVFGVDLKGTLGYTEEEELIWKGITDATRLNKIINHFVSGIEIKIKDVPYTFTVNTLDLAKLAGCGVAGTGTDYSVKGDESDTFVTIFCIIWAIVGENRETIDSILDNVLSEDLQKYVREYIDNVLDKSEGDILRALVDLFDGFNSSGHVADWSFLTNTFTAQNVVYSTDVPKTDVEFLINSISDIADKALAKYLLKDADSLVEFLSQKLYTQDIVDKLNDLIYDNLATNETVTTILDLLGIELKSEDKPTCIISDDNAEADFIDALVAILKPFEKVVDAFLTEGEIKVAGVLTITGSNGFDNAIKPLLEYAFGADLSAITDDEKNLKGLLTALLGRVDEILSDPVAEVLELIPTLANFIDKGGVQNFIEELLYPIIHMVAPIINLIMPASTDDDDEEEAEFFDVVLDIVQGLDLVDLKGILGLGEDDELTWKGITNNDTIHKILNGFLKELKIGDSTYTFTVNELTLKKLAECGKRNGTDDEKNYKIDGDKADTFVTIFNIIWAIVKENRTEIDNLITNVLGDGKVKDIAGKYITNVLNSSCDDVLKALVGVFKGLDSHENKADWSFLVDGYSSEAVNYTPYEFEKSDVQDLIDKISTIADKALEAYVLNGADSLGEFLASKLYTADTVNAIINALNGLVDNDTVKMILGLLDITLEVKPEVTNINGKDDFIAALVDVLSPFESVVNAFLKSGTISIAGVLDITGHDGFDNALKPLLEYALGATVTEEATLEGLLKAVLGRVDEILADPVDQVLGLIPTLANFIDKGGVQYFIEQLLYPIIHILTPVIELIADKPAADEGELTINFFDFVINLVDDIVPIVSDNKDFKLKDTLGVSDLSWKNLHKQIVGVANHFLAGLKIKGNEYTFTVNALDLAKLASRNTGKVNDYGLVGDRPDTFVTIFQILWAIVKENRTTIDSLIDNLLSKEGEEDDKLTSTLKEYIGNVLDKSEGDIIEALIEVFNGFDATHTADWSFLTDDFKKENVDYNALGVDKDEVADLIDTISEFAKAAIKSFVLKDDYATIGELLEKKVYTQDLVDKLNDLIYDNLANNGTVTMILGLLGVELKSENKPTCTVTDKNSFIQALADILAPFNGLVAAFLDGDSVEIAKVLTIIGADGFNNAIKPLLEYALAANAGNDSSIKGILTAVLGRVEEIADAPVDEVLEMIPSLVNFIDKGGIQYFVEELLYPVIGLINPIIKLIQPKGAAEISVFDFALTLVDALTDLDLAGKLGVEEVTWKGITSQIPAIINHFLEGIEISGEKYTFTVNALVFSHIAQAGGAKNTANGLIIDGDREDTFVTIFDIIWAIVKENRQTVDSLIDNLLANNEEGAEEDKLTGILKEYIGNVLDKESGDVLRAIVDVLDAIVSPVADADWSFLTDGYANVGYDYEKLFGVSKEDVEGLIETVNDIANKALGEFVLGDDYATLADFVGGMLYQQKFIDSIQSAINSLAENTTIIDILGYIGIELTVNDTVYTINGKDSFIDALADILAPFEPLLKVLLDGGEVTLGDKITINGMNTFANAIKPLLVYAFGVEDFTDSSLKGILTAVLDRVDDILDNPVEEVLELIPLLVNFINEGGIQYFVEQLLAYEIGILEPIVKLIQPKGKELGVFDFAISLVEKIADIDLAEMLGVKEVKWDTIHEQIPEIVNGIVADLKITIGEGEYSFTLKSLDFDKLAHCGERNGTDAEKNYKIDGDKADTFVTLFDIIWAIVQDNKDTIKDILGELLGDDIMDVAGEYIDNLLKNKSGDIIKALVEFFKAFDSSAHIADWRFLTENHKYQAAKYPNGVTADDIDELIATLSLIAENAINEFILDGDVESLVAFVGDMLYTQKLIDDIQGAINSLAGNETVTAILDLLGVTLTENTKTYTVTDKDSFIDALADILAPFDTIINAFLNAGDITVAGVVTFTSSDVYNNAIRPLLEYAFGVEGLENVQTGTLKDILTALLDRVDEILDNPVDEVLGLIPMLTNFINEGGIQYFVYELLYPVLDMIEPLLSLITDESLFDFVLSFINLEELLGVKGITWDNIHKKIPAIVNGFLEGIQIGDGEYTFTVNKLDFSKLAACGHANGLVVEGSNPDTFITIFGILWDIVQENKKAIEGLLDSLDINDTIRDIIDHVLGQKSDDIIKALVDVLKGFDSSGHIADWRFLTNTYKSKSPKYPNGITASDVDEMINTLSTILENALTEFILKGDYASLADFVGGKLYTGDLIKTVQNLINSLAENETVTMILGLLDVELEVNNKSYKVTDKNSFINALADILAPFDSLVEAFLSEGDITIAGMVTLTSSDVFNNAIKPLLEYALGCTNVKDASIKGILTAVLNRVDEILADPVDEVLGLIPMLTNFINQGGVQYFVEELLYPILNVASPILALITDKNVFDFAFELLDVESMLGVKNVTWKNIHKKIPAIINGFLQGIEINGGKYTFTVNSLDFAALAACGKAKGLIVDGNNPDTFVTLFGIIWSIVQENRKSIDSLLDSLLSDNIKDIAGEYIDHVLDKDSTDIVKALVKVFKGFNASDHKADWSFLFKNYKQTNVKYPKDVTSADIEEVIDILTVAIENALDIFLDTSLTELVGGIVYTDSIINTVKDLVNSLAKNDTVKSVLGLLGMDITVNNKTYKVTDKASFAAALADVLKPFEPILNAFLNKGSITIADVVTITGADGFNNAVKPLLEYALGCTNVNDRSLKGIITAVLDRVEEILANPVEELVDLLPMLSNFIGKGGVQYFVEELLYPVINIADAILELITDENLFDFAFNLLGVDIKWSNAQNEIVPLLNSLLKNVKINGKSYSITIPSINWSKLGGCGKLSGTSIRANQGDTVMTLLEYIFKALEANKNMIFDLVGDNATIRQIINNVLDQGAGGMARIVVRILLKMETFDNVLWTFKKIKHVETTYTENYTEENFAEIVEQIDDVILGMLANFLKDINVPTLLNDKVYNSGIVNTVAKLVYTNLEKINLGGISIHQILRALDLDITTSGVAAMLKDYRSASAEIGKHATWSEVNFDNINWNFTDGDRTGFVNALSAALRPIQPLLRVILSGEDLIVLGSIHIKGGNGYNTTVIPLLEAIGIDAEDLVTATQYNKEADTDKVLTSILNPVLDFAETLLNKPILTLCNMLPNVAYFLLNGGAQAIVENFAGPVFNLLDEIAPIYDLDVDKILKDAIGFGISDLGDLDLDELVNSLLAKIEIKGQPLTIRITDIDLETLAGRGELVEYTSARTYNGVRMECKKIDADAPAVFVSVLRYIVENLKANLDAIVELLAGLGLPSDIADIVNQILTMLAEFDVDGVIEALLEILFPLPGGEVDGPDAVAPYPVGNFYWVHWALLAGGTLFLLLIFLILLKKKDEEEEEENLELAEGEAPQEETGKKAKKAKKSRKQK